MTQATLHRLLRQARSDSLQSERRSQQPCITGPLPQIVHHSSDTQQPHLLVDDAENGGAT